MNFFSNSQNVDDQHERGRATEAYWNHETIVLKKAVCSSNIAFFDAKNEGDVRCAIKQSTVEVIWNCLVWHDLC